MDFLSPLSEYVFKSRYARFLKGENRRENWNETVDRYISFFKEHTGSRKVPWEQLREGITKLEVVPSMRSLMTAGPALARDNVAGYNCFEKDTKLLTKEYGTVSFNELGEGANITVLCEDKEWRPAVVHTYGRQALQGITFRPGTRTNIRHTIYATPNHQWVTENRGLVDSIQVGDRIRFNAVKSNFDLEDFIRGFIFGDGTIQGQVKVRLCGDKIKLLPLFKDYGKCSINYPPSSNGEPIIIFKTGVLSDAKELPNNISTSWFEGYYAADGAKSTTQPNISTQNQEAATLIYDRLAESGYGVTGSNVMYEATNYGIRSGPLHRIGIQDNFVYTVTEVAATNLVEEVWCVEEPITNTFTLQWGIVTRNCAYVAVDSIRVFDEIMYVLMCGTGVGFSVERQYIAKLPEVAEEFHEVQTTIDVGDSKIGWASAFRQLVGLLYQGQIPRWNLAAIRPAGAILHTFGGRASGPEPLGRLFGYCVQTFRKAKGRRLTSLEVHDIVCKIAEVVVVGGVRRSALLSLSNLTDARMAVAKSGNWFDLEPQRRFANNSVAYTETPDMGIFMKEWQALYESKSGERGIFNRVASDKMKPERREGGHDWGTNPCSEIVLRSKQFCNLSEAVLRKDDTCADILRKVEMATILGTVQASLTGFRYLSSAWKRNTEEEALLGVSLTGIMDCPHTRKPTGDFLRSIKQHAMDTNEKYARYLGINRSAAITCVKPSGTVSQLVDAASGIHPRYAKHYIRRVRADINDPLCLALERTGVPGYQSTLGNSEKVYEFPVRSPEGATVVSEVTALEQLEHWKKYAVEWCEHKPSISVYVRENEWLEVGAWCYKNFDVLNGVSFFPVNDHIYQEAPYEEITAERYTELMGTFPKEIDLTIAEESDVTTASQEVACQGGQCEL